MDALTQANLRLLKRLDELESRLARLEGRAAAPVAGSPPDTTPEAPRQEQPWEPAPPPTPVETLPDIPPERSFAPAAPPAAPAPRHPSVETSLGLNWLNRIGAFTLILGAAFFFKYAVDNEWIGPTGRVLLGILTGFGLLAGAEKTRRAGHSVYAQGLAGAGVSVLYLAFWAAASLYQLIPVWLAFSALAADTVLAAALALRHGSIALAVLGLLGGYLTPPALSTGEYHPWFYFSYMFALNAGWLTVARRQGWRIVELIALPCTLFLCAVAADDLHVEDEGRIGTFAALSQYLVFSLSPIALYPVIAQIVAGLSLGSFWEAEVGGFAPPALALIVAGLYVAHWRRVAMLAPAALAGFVAGYLIVHGTAPAASRDAVLATAICGFAILHAWLPFRVLRGAGAGREELSMQAANAVFIFAAGYDLLGGRPTDWRGLFAAALAAVYLATGYFLWRHLRDAARDKRSISLLAGISIALLTAAIPLQFDSFRITAMWAFETAVLAWIARRVGGWQARAAVVAVLALTLGRLAAVDAMATAPAVADTLLFNARFLTFLLAALSFALAAYWLRPERWALAPWVSANFSLLLGLCVETSRYVRRTATTDAVSVEMVSLSILIAAYGLALVAGGVATRTRINRVLGLGLLAIVILKLYLVDVWTMRRIYRIIAFGGLGAVLLATSFLYSRFRGKIEALLQDETR